MSETPIYDELFNLLMPPLPPTKAYIEMMTSSARPWRRVTGWLPRHYRVPIPASLASECPDHAACFCGWVSPCARDLDAAYQAHKKEATSR